MDQIPTDPSPPATVEVVAFSLVWRREICAARSRGTSISHPNPGPKVIHYVINYAK